MRRSRLKGHGPQRCCMRVPGKSASSLRLLDARPRPQVRSEQKRVGYAPAEGASPAWKPCSSWPRPARSRRGGMGASRSAA